MSGFSHKAARHAILMTAALAFGGALAGCETTEQLRQADLDQDRRTCADFGALPGSAQHARCMMSQQERRDDQALDAQTRALISAETARTNV